MRTWREYGTLNLKSFSLPPLELKDPTSKMTPTQYFNEKTFWILEPIFDIKGCSSYRLPMIRKPLSFDIAIKDAHIAKRNQIMAIMLYDAYLRSNIILLLLQIHYIIIIKL